MKTIPHIKRSQKKKVIKSSGKPCFATYPEDQDLYEALGIPFSIKRIVLFPSKAEKKELKENISSLEEEIKGLGFRVLQKSELTPLRFKTPVPQKNHHYTMEKIQNILDVSQKKLAEIIGCSPKKIWSILNVKNECFKRKGDINNFNQLVSLINQLLGIFKEESLKKWIRTAQKNLGNKKPIDLFISGNVEPLRNWIYKQLEGVYQ
jgi:hypothetical protein